MARPPSFDKATVIEAAQRQFRLHGYAGTSLDDITAATGLGRGSLYAAFGDKHGLFIAALSSYCEVQSAAVRELLTGPDDAALLRLRSYLAAAVGFVTDIDAPGCMVGRFAVEVSGEDDEARQQIHRDLEMMVLAVTHCIQAAQRHGDIEPEVPARDVAWLLITTVRGIDVVSRVGAESEQMEAVAGRLFAGLPLTRKGRARLRKTDDAVR